MKLMERIRLGLSIIFGKTYGIIIDGDYATGGSISHFHIKDADIGVMMYGSPDVYIEDSTLPI